MKILPYALFIMAIMYAAFAIASMDVNISEWDVLERGLFEVLCVGLILIIVNKKSH